MNGTAVMLRPMTTRRRLAEAAGLYIVLAVAGAIVYFAFAIPDRTAQHVVPALGLAMVAAVMLRLALAVRPRRLDELGAARCPRCRYALDGLSLPGVCPECGVGYHADSIARREVTLDRAALVRVALAFLGLLLAVTLPLPFVALREASLDRAASVADSLAYAIAAVLFVPHAMCSAVIGKFFSARVFRGYWLGGLTLGLAGQVAVMLAIGERSLGMRIGALPVPAAATGLGLALGCVAGLLLARAATAPKSG